MTGFVKGRRDNDIWCHNLANCQMPTTKSCTFVGGRDATVALPAWFKHILFDQSLLHRYNIKEVGSDSKP